MKDRIIRAIVVLAYVEVDDVLNRAILNDVFGRRGLSRKSKKYRMLEGMLDRLYPQQKLDILKLSRDVPTQVSNHIMALNTLRNTFAHQFHLADVPRSRRLYKSRYDVFTKKGLEKFNSDMWEIDEFFDLSLPSSPLNS